MTASIDGLTLALLPLVLATCTLVVTLGVRAFPGWAGGGVVRWVRTGVLVTTSMYVVLAAAVLYGIGSTRAAGGPVTTGDADAAVRVLVLGVAAVLLLSLLATMRPADEVRREGVGAATPWCAAVMAVVLGLYAADGVIDMLYEPAGIAILLGMMVALGVAFDAFLAADDRRAARQARARLVRAMRRSRREAGGDLVPCVLEDDSVDGHQITHATTTTDGDFVLLELPGAGEVATWLRTGPPVAERSARYAAACLHDSWLDGASLTLKRGEAPLREQRQAPEPGQRRGYPVGLIKVPAEMLTAAGIRVRTRPPAPARD
ncbi:MAG: hypothetical protein AB7G37_07940 [Solirubrobacteraceae bacterium]